MARRTTLHDGCYTTSNQGTGVQQTAQTTRTELRMSGRSSAPAFSCCCQVPCTQQAGRESTCTPPTIRKEPAMHSTVHSTTLQQTVHRSCRGRPASPQKPAVHVLPPIAGRSGPCGNSKDTRKSLATKPNLKFESLRKPSDAPALRSSDQSPAYFPNKNMVTGLRLLVSSSNERVISSFNEGVKKQQRLRSARSWTYTTPCNSQSAWHRVCRRLVSRTCTQHGMQRWLDCP